MTFATIDIGTNAVLLLVAEYPPLKVLRDEARITRLGEGLHEQPLFLRTAQERTLAVLKDYKSICDSFSVEKNIAVGTAAFRKAKNTDDFIQQVKKETGITIEIISGEEEARLSYLSATTDFPEEANLLVLDIGGGSTEIISKDGSVSLDLGAVVLSEKIIKHDPPTEKEISELLRSIDKILVGAQFMAPSSDKPAKLVGLAGSVTTLSAIKQRLTDWDGSRVQGSILTTKDLDEMISLFQKTTNEQRSKIPGMVKGREDTILAGTLILRKVMDHVGIDQVTVSDRGLRYGLIYDRS